MFNGCDLQFQEDALRTIDEDIRQERLNHAYMIEGMYGIGKHTFARYIAKRILCQNQKEAPCQSCRSCNLFDSGNHPDILEISRTSERLVIGDFAEGREQSSADTPVIPFLRLVPLISNRRVVIIPDAERMEIEPANAFLKTLEEPPKSGFIIMTTSIRDRIVPTIISRCRRIQLKPLPINKMKSIIQKRYELTHELAEEIAALSDGSLGLAIQMLSENVIEDWEWICNSWGNSEELIEGLTFRVEKTGKKSDNESIRKTALRLLSMLALRLRRQLRESNRYPESTIDALDRIWESAEQIHSNVPPPLAILQAVNALAYQ